MTGVVSESKSSEPKPEDRYTTGTNREDPFQYINETSFDAIIVANLEGSILQMNETAAEEFCYESKEAMQGVNITSIVAMRDGENPNIYLRVFKMMGKSSSTIRKKRRRFMGKRQDGSEFPCLIGVNNLAGSDHIVVYVTNTEVI